MLDLDDPRMKRLISGLQAGADLETAVHFAGLSVPEVYRWLELGKLETARRESGHDADPDFSGYVLLWEELRQKRAEVIVRNLAAIQNAAQNGEWRAAGWWLERAVPEQFSRPASEKRGAEIQETPRQITED